ncbi:MAG: tetratricopeptide repeat protein [Acidobacteriota bacterium]|nr:tetratricopeptide repeat protein [Acidobacteriota bacterium]
MEIPESLIFELRSCIAERAIDRGLGVLAKCSRTIEEFDPCQANAAAFLGYVAQWVDIGFADGGVVRGLLDRFPKGERERLALADFAYLRMAEGQLAMAEEEFEKASADFETVLWFEKELSDRQLAAIARFWLARCHRRVGRYQEALRHNAIAKRMALEQNLPLIAAVMQILEGWIAFQEGEPERAAKILGEAEALLRETDDWVTLGNIQSAYGRIARRQGRYHQALEYFAKAIEQYKKRNPRHRNLGRSLANIAFVQRLVALDLRTRMDREAARRRKKPKGGLGPTAARRSSDRKRLERLREEAFEHLAEAEQIYRHYDDHRGAGAVHVNRGLLYLDSGELERAKREADAAYQLGAEKQDFILRARARILGSAVESAKFEEQLEEAGDRAHPAQLACDYAREAVEYAKHTENRRLLAKAHIALGTTLANEFFNDPRGAQQCCDEAAALLDGSGRDYVRSDLQKLRRVLLSGEGIDFTLREWSHGLVGDRTFQQVDEEFAGIVISKVWMREGRKVSRVAEKLSISPKKVRRVLRNMGLLRRGE